MAITIIILLLIASIAMSYSIWNLIRQNEDLEDTVIYYQTKLSNLRQQVLDMEIQLKEINPGSPGGSEKTPNTEGGIQEVFLDLQKARQAEGKSTRVYRSNLPAEFQSNFRWDSLTLNQIGENLKVLSRVAYELSFRATDRSQDELVSKSIPITVWALTENGESEFKIINNGPLYQSFLDYSFFTKYDPEIETTENRFLASQVRYYVNFNFRFAKDILLPALRD